MDVEKLGKKKRSAESKSGFESDDDEPIGMMFKVKSRKKVKVEGDGGLDDTLATFRKKLKKGSRVRAPKRGDLDADVKVTDSDAKLETLAEEVNVDGDVIVESEKKEENKKSERGGLDGDVIVESEKKEENKKSEKGDLDIDMKKTDSAAKLETVEEEVSVSKDVIVECVKKEKIRKFKRGDIDTNNVKNADSAAVSEDVIVESVKKEKNKRSKRRDLDIDVKNSDVAAKLETVAKEVNVLEDVIVESVKKEKNKKPKRGDLDTNVKNTDPAAKSETVAEVNVSEDVIVESVKKEKNKKSKRGDLDTNVKKTDSAAKSETVAEELNVAEDVIFESVKKERNKKSKSKSAKKKALGEDLTENDLEDSLSSFLIKSKSGSLQKSSKMLKVKQAKSTQACHDGSNQKPDGLETVEIEANKGPTVNKVIDGDDVNHSSCAITKMTIDVSETEVQEKKMDHACTIPESVPVAGFITDPTSPADPKISPVSLVHNETMNQGLNPNPVGDCDGPNNETVSVSSQKANASTSDCQLSPVSSGRCNKFADENEAYASENGSMLDPETKLNKKPAGKRIVRQAKRHRHDDMAYEGDADWDTLIHEHNLFVNHQDEEKVQSVKTKGKLDCLQMTAVDAESVGVAAVSVGLKARTAGPVEKMKFKELLKHKGGLQDYIECRNHILHLWNKDVTRILPLSECGVSDTAVADEHPQASLIRDIYAFLDQYSYINFGVASKKEISDASIKPNFRLSGDGTDGRKSGDLEDGVSFIMGGTKKHDNLTDEVDTVTEFADSAIRKDKDLDRPDSPCPNIQAEDSVNQKEPTVCTQCDDSETRKKIIVIGAGPAGLTAARHLARLGFHVTVLEARDRIGGRVFTDRSSLSVPVDLGASIITGVEADVTSQRRPDPSSLICAQLGLELTVLDSDCPLYDTVTGQKVPADLDEAVEAEYNSLLDDMQLVVAQKGDHAMQMSLEEGLEYGLKIRRAGQDKTGTEEEMLSPLERRVMDWHLAHLEYGCAASLQQVSLPYWNQDDIYGGFGGAHCMIKGGYSAVVDSLKVGLHIHLNCIVTDIEHQQEDESTKKVKICTQNGKVFTGDAVLITVPLGCLKAETIKFSPPLPDWKHSSIKRLGFGVLNKVILEFPEVFWDESVDYFGATSEQTDQRGWCFMFWNVKKTVNAPVLIALVVGKSAINDQDLSSSDHVNHALVVLRKFFGEGAVRDPVASVVTDWGRDPFSYGAYSYVAVGASGDDYDTLGRPVNNCLFFAGEATCKEHPDTVGGAMMSGLREAVRIVDILTTGNDFTAEVEAIAAAKRHSNSERSEVRDIIKRLDAIDLTNVHKNSLLQNMFRNAKSRAGRLHLVKELLSLPSDILKSFAGTKEGLTILNSWILDSMGKNGTQLLRQCVRLLVLVSTDLLAVRLSGIGKTVKEKVCVHTSRDIRAIASQLVSVWIEIFRKEKASNGGLKLLRQASTADASRSKSHLASGKPPLRSHHMSKGVTKLETKPSSSQGSAGKQHFKEEEEDNKDLPLTEEEQAAIDAAEAARAAALAAAEAYASSGVKSITPLQLPKIPSFNKFARREQYAQMDESEFHKNRAGGVTGRQDCISEIDSRNCRVRDWPVDFSAAGINPESSKMSVDNRSQQSLHSNENAGPLGHIEHSGDSTGVDNTILTEAWIDGEGSEGIKDHSAIDRWQSQAAAADLEFYNRSMRALNEGDSKNLKPIRRHDGLANDSSASQVTVNKELVGNQHRGVDKIKQAVVDYVASLLMPLYKERKVDRGSYKSIMKKTAAKVMEATTDAEKTMAVFEFLDSKRKNKIRAFVDMLIERHMAMKTEAKSGGS